MTAPTAPPVDVAARVLERLNIELAEPADVDNGLAVAALAIAYDRVKPAGPTHAELGELEVKLAAAQTELAGLDDLRRSIACVRVAMLDLGPRADLLAEGILAPLGQALEDLVATATRNGLVVVGLSA